ncbi:hypothetical protein DITRI_Ditri07aG0087600 [Diplodiscus trichospermus]
MGRLSIESFRYIIKGLRLTLPSIAMVCIDARFKNNHFSGVNVLKGEWGAEKPNRAKNAMVVTLKLVLALVVVLALTMVLYILFKQICLER